MRLVTDLVPEVRLVEDLFIGARTPYLFCHPDFHWSMSENTPLKWPYKGQEAKE